MYMYVYKTAAKDKQHHFLWLCTDHLKIWPHTRSQRNTQQVLEFIQITQILISKHNPIKIEINSYVWDSNSQMLKKKLQ